MDINNREQRQNYIFEKGIEINNGNPWECMDMTRHPSPEYFIYVPF